MSYKITEKPILPSGEKNLTMIDYLDELIFIVDLNGNIVETNNSVNVRLGYQKEEIYGKPFESLLSPESRDVSEGITDGKLMEAAGTYHLNFLSRSGIKIIVETKVVYGSWNGAPVVFCISKDISKSDILADVFDKNPMSIQIIDKHGCTVKVNQAHTLLFGTLFPSDYSVFNDPQLRQSGFSELFDKLKKGEIVHFPDAYYKVHNANPLIPEMSIYLRMIGFPINYTDEIPERFVLMHENITNRRIADDALRKSESLFRSVVHNSSDLIIFTDEKGILRYVSPLCKKILGYPANKFVGDTLQEIIHPDDKMKCKLSWDKLLNYGQEEHDFIYRIIDDEKKVRWISQNSKLLKDTDISIGIQSTLRDITEQRLAEEALRESEEQYRLLFENATQSIAVLQDYKIQFANPKCLEVLGFQMDDILSKSFSEFVYPDDRSMVHEKYLKRIQGKQIYQNVFRVLRKDNLVRWVEESGVRIKWHGKDASLIFLSDLTIRKKAEEELNNSLEELHQLTQHMQEVREQERMGISRELHDDLGQALTAVKIDLGIIKQEITDTEICNKVDKVSALVSDTIKTVQRLTSNLRPDIINDLGLETAIEWYAKEYSQRSGIIVSQTVDPGIDFSPANALNIFRIVQESLTNISRHAEATKVEISLKKNAESCILSISDNGIGINENEVKSRQSFGLMGMKERSVSLGGTFDIRNNKKNGTEIKIIIPLPKK